LSEIKKEGTHITEYDDYIFLYTGKKSGRNGVGKSFQRIQSGLTPNERYSLNNIFTGLSKGTETCQTIQETYNDLLHRIKNSVSKLPSRTQKNKLEYIITEKTKDMIKERTKLTEKPLKTIAERKTLKQLYGKIRKCIKRNKESFRMKIFEEELDKRRSVKRGNKRVNNDKPWIQTLKNNSGATTTNRNNILKIATNFYRKLYSMTEQRNINDTHDDPSALQSIKPEEIPVLLEKEIKYAITNLKTMKSPVIRAAVSRKDLFGRYIMVLQPVMRAAVSKKHLFGRYIMVLQPVMRAAVSKKHLFGRYIMVFKWKEEKQSPVADLFVNLELGLVTFTMNYKMAMFPMFQSQSLLSVVLGYPHSA
ncbi:Endonuclease-reverse transcriptase, partial [Operophtera brumata]